MKESIRRRLGTAALILFCALPGIYAFFLGSLVTFEGIWRRDPGEIAIGCVVAMAGSLLVLVGTRRWGQWGYLLVFAGFLSAMSVSFIVDPPVGPGNKGLDAILYGALGAFVMLAAVKTYYYRKGKRT